MIFLYDFWLASDFAAICLKASIVDWLMVFFSRWITMDGDCGRVVGFIDQNFEKYTKGRASNKNSITILFTKVSRHKVGKTSSWSKASLFLKSSGSLNWTFTRIYHTEKTTWLYRIRVQTFSEMIAYRSCSVDCLILHVYYPNFTHKNCLYQHI